MKNRRLKYIAITTGDLNGIGLEVTAKALPSLIHKPVVFLMWRHQNSRSPYLLLLKKKFRVLTFKCFDSAKKFLDSRSQNELLKEQVHSKKPFLIDISSNKSPPHWVFEVGSLAYQGKIHGMVTGPLSKTSLHRSGLKGLGHNEVLKKIAGVKKTYMGFVGRHFSVVLATGHIPLRSVARSLSPEELGRCLLETNRLRKQLGITSPIKVLGLNPHSGEDGLIGQEEETLFAQLRVFSKRFKIPIEGPLVPDAAFLKKNWSNEYPIYLSLYHDQGLIPFKLVHGQNSGYQVSLGLPFVRTSVDHGTAKDIYDKSIANPGSMRESLLACLKFSS